MNRQGRPGKQKTREECSKNLEGNERARSTEGVHVNVVSQRHERNEETLSLDMQLKKERVTRDRSTTARQTVRVNAVNDGGNKKYHHLVVPVLLVLRRREVTEDGTAKEGKVLCYLLHRVPVTKM